MLRGLYISTTNMKGNTTKIDVISNNIANMNTYGFKKDSVQQQSFNDILLQRFDGSSLPVEGKFTGVKSIKNKDKSYEVSTEVGYFRLETEQGMSHNKSAKFFVDKDGYLSTGYYNTDRMVDPKKGDKIIGKTGQPVFVGTGNVEIDKNGNVSVDGSIVDNLVYFPPINAIGTTSAGVMIKGMVTDFTQGNLVPTENRFDFGLDSPGFFVIETPVGTAYTRSGAFKLNDNYELMSNEGYYVQGTNGNIKLPSDQFTVNEFGEIVVDGNVVDKVKVVDFSNKWDLEKVGITLYKVRNLPEGEEIAYKGKVINGMLEQSNADSVTEMIKLMSMYREYESGQKIVKAYDEVLNKACNDIGRV